MCKAAKAATSTAWGDRVLDLGIIAIADLLQQLAPRDNVPWGFVYHLSC